MPCTASETCTNTVGSYSCACTKLVNQAPAMTSNTAPSGVVSSSSDFPTYPAFQAFDFGGNTGGGGMWISEQYKAPALLYRLNISDDNATTSTRIDVISIGELRVFACGP
ncbi:MAG TPA: hypothetical protein VFK05_22340 [Polyangiaceae bacterium]|nr:hypothetical protein [Polyangiaceae bacterium]